MLAKNTHLDSSENKDINMFSDPQVPEPDQ